MLCCIRFRQDPWGIFTRLPRSTQALYGAAGLCVQLFLRGLYAASHPRVARYVLVENSVSYLQDFAATSRT